MPCVTDTGGETAADGVRVSGQRGNTHTHTRKQLTFNAALLKGGSQSIANLDSASMVLLHTAD